MKTRHHETTQSINQAEKLSPLRKLVTIGALSSIALTGCVAQQAPERPETTTEAPAEVEQPQETEAPEKSFEELVNERKIEAGLSAEDYAKILFEERWVEWQEPFDEDRFYAAHHAADGKDAIREVEQLEAEANTKVFANALFLPGWQDTLAVLAEQRTETARIDLGMWARTRFFNEEIVMEDLPLYETGMVVERVDVVSENPELGTRTIYVAGYQTNNITETSYANAANDSYERVNGAPWGFHVTTVVIDGTEYISDWSN
ncbi:MAG: hypothetical protein WDA07_10985 [Leucobacter sp.]